MRRLLKISLGILGVLVAAVLAAVGYVTYIGTPAAAASLDFKGFVPLRSDTALTVLDYLTVDADTLFVTSESSGAVYRIHLTKDSVPTATDVSTLPGEPAAHGVVIDPTSRLAFVTRSEANTVDVFDPVKMAVVKRIPIADDADAIFYDAVDKLIYVASGDSHVATLIDPSTQAEVATIPLGGKPEYAAIDAPTGFLFQNLRDTGELLAVDIAKRAVVQRWPLQGCGAPTGMALDEANRRLFIGCNTNAVLAVFDLDQHRIVATVPIGKGPDTVAFDASSNRIYAAGKSGDLTVVQQDAANKYRVLDTIHLHYGAHTLVVDPATHGVYVGYASLFVSPRVAVFFPRP
jgi:YVTN family beta-propeller protein